MSNYSEFGWKDAKDVDSTTYLLNPIRNLLKKTDCILDMGCGNGNITNHLLKEGYNIYGIDASENGIKYANSRAVQKGRFFVCEFSEMKLPDELKDIKFNVVISTEVIEHVYSPQQFIEFCTNSLISGGCIVLSTPYHGYLKNLALSITGKWDRHFGALNECGHIKFWSKKTLTELLERNGIKVVGFTGCGRVPYLWKSMILVGVNNNK
jgi:2-polyprenyl-3-methyl-5-hydroxy-6-metoxy-1,4-benzoquinol methylase